MMGWNGRSGMWYASRDGEVFSSSDFESTWCFAMGYGGDFASKLRYLMDEIHKEEKND